MLDRTTLWLSPCGKNGLRFWLSRGSEDDFGWRCAERWEQFYRVRLPSYQVDREVLDEHVLCRARGRRGRLAPGEGRLIRSLEAGPPVSRFATAAESAKLCVAG